MKLKICKVKNYCLSHNQGKLFTLRNNKEIVCMDSHCQKPFPDSKVKVGNNVHSLTRTHLLYYSTEA